MLFSFDPKLLWVTLFELILVLSNMIPFLGQVYWARIYKIKIKIGVVGFVFIKSKARNKGLLKLYIQKFIKITDLHLAS